MELVPLEVSTWNLLRDSTRSNSLIQESLRDLFLDIVLLLSQTERSFTEIWEKSVRFWKKSKVPNLRRRLQQWVLQGVSREELLQEALAEVMRGGGASRFGVWLEPATEDRRQEGVLRGVVWDSEIPTPPREWQLLAPQTVLHSEVLLCEAAMEVDLTKTTQPIVGPLAGLGRAVWTPVQRAGKLQGILLAGTREIRNTLPREKLLDVSAEIAVALAFEEERKASNERYEDTVLCRRILAGLQSGTPPERLLQRIAESCLRQPVRPYNPGATFAAVAKVRGGSEAIERPRITLEFLCTAGSADANQFAAHETVKTLIRNALDSGQTAGAEIRQLSGEEFLRLIVVPMPVRGKTENILLAAFPAAKASLASLERLELRGWLAASVLSAMDERAIEASQELRKKVQEVAKFPVPEPVRAEEKRAEAELLNLAEWLDQGVILYDEDGNVRLLNLRFAQMAGLALEEFETYRTLDVLIERLKGQAANPEVFAQHWRALANREKGGERDEVNLVRPAARVLERASRPVLDMAGKPMGRIELYKDLTAQRVFQAKLLQTERLAALGQMVSGVAHELSNPLTSILGYAQRLLLRNDGEGNCEEIRKIFGEAERAGAILRRMLLAARETAPERRLFSLNQIVQRAIDLQRFSLAADRIQMDVFLDPTLPNVLGDAGQLQQVLINLIGNARHAIESQAHGGTIRVRTSCTQDKRVRLEVSDSGPGIPEAIMARIFDPFFTTKPAGVGTGLGLSIVLSLVREHGGQVIVSSPRGSGATFVVELPLAEPQETSEEIVQRIAAVQSALRVEANAAQARKTLGAQRVLVVEDELTVAQLISDVLRDAGFEIEVLLDGRDALQRAFCARFDLIICDMKMPNLDGQTLYQTLSNEGKGAPKPFLFVTGDVLGAKTHEFLAKHRLPYVPKPFRVEELLEKVHQTLQTSAHRGSWHATALRQNSATAG
jgi:signal transduction histidine kinase/AmiR/NasT family two-component response regulator